MPTRTYTLNRDQDQNLEIAWEKPWNTMTIKLNGHKIGSVADQKALMEGQNFQLPDGTNLKVQLIQEGYTIRLQVFHDEKKLQADSTIDLPLAIFLLGGINALLGLLALLSQEPFLQDVNFGIRTIAFGGMWIVLGFFIKRKSTLAITLTFGLWMLDCLFSYVHIANELGAISFRQGIPAGILVRVAILFTVLLGTKAIPKPDKKHTQKA